MNRETTAKQTGKCKHSTVTGRERSDRRLETGQTLSTD